MEVKAADESEKTQLETTMLEDSFSTQVQTNIQNIDPDLATITVEVEEYVPRNNTVLFFFLGGGDFFT